MAVHKIEVEEIKENIFLDMEVPVFEKFKIKLTQKSKILKIKKSGEEISRVDNYDLFIDTSEIAETNLSETKETLRDIMELSFVPYLYDETYNAKKNDMIKVRTKTIKYFTHGKQSIEKKKEILEKIFNCLKDFELNYEETVKDSVKAFNADVLEHQSYKDFDIAVKYSKENNAFFVLALRYLDDKYKTLAQASHLKGKLSEAPLPEDFFNDLVKPKSKGSKVERMFFMIKPEAYLEIKDLIEVQKLELAEFKEEQKKLVASIEGQDLPIYTKENVFDFKIDFDKELNCFKFFCKGYDPGEYESIQTERNLFGTWALNFIFSKQLTDEEMKDFTPYYGYEEDTKEFFFDNLVKIDLKFLDGSSKKDKNFLISADQIDSLRKIKENFLKLESFFSRKQEVVQIIGKEINPTDTTNLKKYPAILIGEKGNPYFVFSYRRQKAQSAKQTEQENHEGVLIPAIPQKITETDAAEEVPKKIRKRKDKLASISMTTIPISYEEMLYFINEHPMADRIKSNTVYLNTEAWGSSKNMDFSITLADREEMFNSILLHSTIKNKSIEKPLAKKKKI